MQSTGMFLLMNVTFGVGRVEKLCCDALDGASEESAKSASHSNSTGD